MSIMRQVDYMRCTLAAAAIFAVLLAGGAMRAGQPDDSTSQIANQNANQKGKKPSISLKITPSVAIAPARVRVSAELRGGADDYEDYYCPTIEWDWGDETTSESTKDCEPYAAGRSEITRRFSAEHTYQESGNFKVALRMKRKDKVMGSSSVNIQVQPGLSDR